jgi:hypothetical protein
MKRRRDSSHGLMAVLKMTPVEYMYTWFRRYDGG